MKRIGLLLVILAALLSFPLGSWAVEIPPGTGIAPDSYRQWESQIDTVLAAALANPSRPAGYKYYLIDFQPGGAVSTVYFYTEAVIPASATVYMVGTYASNPSRYTSVGYRYNCNLSTILSGNQLFLRIDTSTGSLLPGYGGNNNGGIVLDRSTAIFYNFFNFDWSNMGTQVGCVDVAIDTSELEALISQAEAMEDIGYTVSSWNRLRNALSTAKNLLAAGGYTQTQVDTAAANLWSAISSLALEPGPIEPPGDHRYLVDGLLPSDILPAYEAMMDSVKQARYYGFFLLAMLLAVPLVVRVLKRILGRFVGW